MSLICHLTSEDIKHQLIIIIIIIIMLCISVEVLTRAHEKGKKVLNDFRFCTFTGRVPSDGATSMAAEGLISRTSCFFFVRWVRYRLGSNKDVSIATGIIVQYNIVARCQYCCTRNVLWCQVRSSHIHADHETSFYNNNNKRWGKECH